MAPGAAFACSGASQLIDTKVAGPILSTGGAITVLLDGIVNGGPTGVSVSSCSVSTLFNSGSISGGSAYEAPGGVGVSNRQTITTLTNSGTIGAGAAGAGAAGGTGVLNAGTIKSLSNSATISGGQGFYTQVPHSSVGGAGVSNAHGATITSLNNMTGGTIEGGMGATGPSASGGAGVLNAGMPLFATPAPPLPPAPPRIEPELSRPCTVEPIVAPIVPALATPAPPTPSLPRSRRCR